MKRLDSVALLFITIAVSACGGGAGGGTLSSTSSQTSSNSSSVDATSSSFNSADTSSDAQSSTSETTVNSSTEASSESSSSAQASQSDPATSTSSAIIANQSSTAVQSSVTSSISTTNSSSLLAISSSSSSMVSSSVASSADTEEDSNGSSSAASVAAKASSLEVTKITADELYFWSVGWRPVVNQPLSDTAVKLVTYDRTNPGTVVDSLEIPLSTSLAELCDEDDGAFTVVTFSPDKQSIRGACSQQLATPVNGSAYSFLKEVSFNTNGILIPWPDENTTSSVTPASNSSPIISLTNDGRIFKLHNLSKNSAMIERFVPENNEWQVLQAAIPVLPGYSTIRPSGDGPVFFDNGQYIFKVQNYNFKTGTICTTNAASTTCVPNNPITSSENEFIVANTLGQVIHRFSHKALLHWIELTTELQAPVIHHHRNTASGNLGTIDIESDAMVMVFADYESNQYTNAHKLSVPSTELSQFEDLIEAYNPTNGGALAGGSAPPSDADLSQCDNAWTGSADDIQVSLLCSTACVYDITNTTEAVTATCQIIAGWNATSSCQPCK